MSRNVVLICLDSVRKDSFDKFAPRLRIRADTEFAACRAASSWTVPSHGSMFTGLLPSQHGIHTHNRSFAGLDQSNTFLSELYGYRTLGVSSNVYASSAFGFDHLFDRFTDITPHRRFPSGMDVEAFLMESGASGGDRYREFFDAIRKHPHSFRSIGNALYGKARQMSRNSPLPTFGDDGARKMTRQIRRLVEATDVPFFLYANFMDAHAPLQHTFGYDRSLHDVPNRWHTYRFDLWEAITDDRLGGHEEDIRRHRQLYGAAIDYLDRKIVELIDWLVDRPGRETTVLVTADHGEELGTRADGYGFEHMSSQLSEGLLHVPLILVNPPDGFDSLVSDYVSHLDLGRLVVGLANGEATDVMRDRIVAERIGLGAIDPSLTATQHREHDRLVRCAYDGASKIVWDSLGRVEKFALDPARASWQSSHSEPVDVPKWALKWFDEDAASAKRRAIRQGDESTLSASVRRRLEDVGYL